jgi:hypothetical protein
MPASAPIDRPRRRARAWTGLIACALVFAAPTMASAEESPAQAAVRLVAEGTEASARRDVAAARQAFDRAVAMADKAGVAGGGLALATRARLARFEALNGGAARARALLRETEAGLAQAGLDPAHATVARAHLAATAQSLGLPAKRLELLEAALASMPGPDVYPDAVALGDLSELADAALAQGRDARAGEVLVLAMARAERVRAQDPIAFGVFGTRVAEIHMDAPEAEANVGMRWALEAKEALAPVLPKDDIRMANLLMVMAHYLHRAGAHEQAARTAMEAVSVMIDKRSADDAGLLSAFARVALYLKAVGLDDQALRYQTAALDRLLRTRGEDRVQVAAMRAALADTQGELGRAAEAEATYAQAQAGLAAMFPGWHPWVADVARRRAGNLMTGLRAPAPAYALLAEQGAALADGPGRARADDRAAAAQYARNATIYAWQVRAGWLAAHDTRDTRGNAP